MRNCNMTNYNIPVCKMPEPRITRDEEVRMRTNDYCRCEQYPIGMAYVPWQMFRELHEPECGLETGTIFKELDKPFLGRRAFRR